MATKPPKISTIVHNVLPLFALRLEFLLGGRIAPEAMARKAALLFTTPFKSSRTRALATPTLGAQETELDIDGDKIHVYVWGDPGQKYPSGFESLPAHKAKNGSPAGGAELFADGSARFIAASIDIRAFAALVTRAGGEVSSVDF